MPDINDPENGDPNTPPEGPVIPPESVPPVPVEDVAQNTDPDDVPDTDEPVRVKDNLELLADMRQAVANEGRMSTVQLRKAVLLIIDGLTEG